MQQPKKVTAVVDPDQDSFYRAVGAILDAYAWFDYNLGLQINFWSPNADKAASVLRADVPMNHRLRYLREMVAASKVQVSEVQKSTWAEWLGEVESIRAFRNDYAHGRWIRLYDQDKATLTWRFAPLTWASETPPRVPIEVTIEELDNQAEQIRRVQSAIGQVVAPYFRRSVTEVA